MGFIKKLIKFNENLIRHSVGNVLLTLFFALNTVLSVQPTFAQNTQLETDINSIEIILFLRETCESCLYVEQKIIEYGIDEKLQIGFLDVDDDTNYKFYRNTADFCQIAYTDLGVPLLYTQEKCYIGTEKVLGYLYTAAGIDIESTISTPGDESILSSTSLVPDQNIVSGEDNSSTAVNQKFSVETQQTPDTSEDENLLLSTQNRVWRPTVKDIIFIVIAPMFFLTIAYLLITRLKL